jgi:nucleotide-binding universal stress UspA family protein
VHVHAPIESIHYPYPRFDTGERKQKMEYLKKIARQIEDAGVRVIPRYIEQRLVAKALCEVGQKVDLVVAATHGYGWLGRLWHDSMVHELMNRLSTPLLVLRGNGLAPAIAPDEWLRRVLVPLDGSPQAEAALTAGAALGTLYDASYSLVSVVHNQVVGPRFLRAGVAWTQSSALEYLRKTAQGMEQELRPADFRVSIAHGAVAQKIVSLAESLSADCIAIARSSRNGLLDWLRPSVTRRVLQLAQSPVLVVGSKSPEPSAEVDAERSFRGADSQFASAMS